MKQFQLRRKLADQISTKTNPNSMKPAFLHQQTRRSLGSGRITAILFCGLLFGFAHTTMAQNLQKRCYTMEHFEWMAKKHPELLQKRARQDAALSQHSDQSAKFFKRVITIPVVFHIIHDGDPVGTSENISDAQIIAQMNQLNDDYSRNNTDAASTPLEFLDEAADVEVQFCFADTDPDGNPTNGIDRVNIGTLPGVSLAACWETSYIDMNIKVPTTWNSRLYLNIWVTQKIDDACAPVLLGYAQLPDMGADETDGVVVVSSTVGSLTSPSGDGGPFDRGRSLTHEVGHWLHLYHIWGDDLGLCTGTDEVADTPNQADENAGCPSHPKVSCGNNEMFMNFMDFTDDLCMNLFTHGQSVRMHDALEMLRPGVISDYCGNCPANLRLTQTDPGTLGLNTTIGYDADFEIQASNVVASGAVVEYRAGRSIRLLPDPSGTGFSAQAGSRFHAVIQDCDGSTKPAANTPRSAGASLVQPNTPTLLVSPNPSSGQFLVQYNLPEEAPVWISISSQSSAVVRHLRNGETEPVGQHEAYFDASHLAPGVYNLLFVCKGKTISQKLVLLK